MTSVWNEIVSTWIFRLPFSKLINLNEDWLYMLKNDFYAQRRSDPKIANIECAQIEPFIKVNDTCMLQSDRHRISPSSVWDNIKHFTTPTPHYYK